MENIKLLIVENDTISRQELGKLFVHEGFDVLLASNGQEALDICFTNETINIILMDSTMPIMCGNVATKLIKEHHPHIPIIAVTGNDSIKDEYKNIGYDGYVLKPLTSSKINYLFALIDSILQKE